ncbi:MAG: hypothetical protein KIG36_07120 [Eubacteriales bacterium]|nr:hypothetical protein [Eubacteriales bacterium]
MLHVKDFLGITTTTADVQTAIDMAAAAGTALFFDAGTYECGTLYLRSGSHLILDDGAKLIGSADMSLYPDDTDEIPYLNEDHMNKCFLFARDARNIVIEGGCISGQREKYKDVMDDRPMLMRFVGCQDITIHDTTLADSAAWVSMYLCCERISLSRVRFLSAQSWNGDGADFNCCRDVIVSDCFFDTGDDAICLQASVPGGVCERVVVRGCVFHSKWALARIGTTSVGHIRDCLFADCIAENLQCSGFKIQAGEGGVIEHLRFENILMRDAIRPIFVTVNRHRFSKTAADPLPFTAAIRDLCFSGMTCLYSPERGPLPDSGLVLTGDPDLVIEDVTLRGIEMRVNGGAETPAGPVPELGTNRPEAYVFNGAIPTYGLYARHVKRLTVDGLRIRLSEPDGRRAVVLEDCPEASCSGVQIL